MESADRIKKAGLKLTPQRKMIYEAMMQLGHASIEEIVTLINSRGTELTISTVYRILDSFCKSNLLTLVTHPETGKCYYDITVREHSHLFAGQNIIDYEDSGLSELVRKYLESKGDIPGEINRVQVQIIMKKDNVEP